MYPSLAKCCSWRNVPYSCLVKVFTGCEMYSLKCFHNIWQNVFCHMLVMFCEMVLCFDLQGLLTFLGNTNLQIYRWAHFNISKQVLCWRLNSFFRLFICGHYIRCSVPGFEEGDCVSVYITIPQLCVMAPLSPLRVYTEYHIQVDPDRLPAGCTAKSECDPL